MAITLNGSTNVITPKTAVQPTGAILQVVSATSSTVDQNPSANDTWTNVDPSASITPSSTSSKILVIPSVACNAWYVAFLGFKLRRTISGTTTDLREWWGYESHTYYSSPQGPQIHLDSPSTTSEVTYRYQTYADNGADYMDWNFSGDTSNSALIKAEIYLVEVAG
tara:strand:+ start:200 stop:697 length:498 start_codon:yes stop_codon:yes gene_type:complete